MVGALHIWGPQIVSDLILDIFGFDAADIFKDKL